MCLTILERLVYDIISLIANYLIAASLALDAMLLGMNSEMDLPRFFKHGRRIQTGWFSVCWC